MARDLATGMHGGAQKKKKTFRGKSENATHNSSVILFSVRRWDENLIRLESGEFPPAFPMC